MTNLLPEELLWDESGHASDIALTAIADGEESIVPQTVHTHVTTCAQCVGHLGNAALLSMHVGRELAVAQHLPARPIPKAAIAIGLGVAGLGFVPTFASGGTLAAAYRFALTDLPQVAHGVIGVLHHLGEGKTGLVVTYSAALIVVMMAAIVVRVLPKKEVSR